MQLLKQMQVLEPRKGHVLHDLNNEFSSAPRLGISTRALTVVIGQLLHRRDVFNSKDGDSVAHAAGPCNTFASSLHTGHGAVGLALVVEKPANITCRHRLVVQEAPPIWTSTALANAWRALHAMTMIAC